jgi:hypothetical protein
MNHLSEEQLILHYYGEEGDALAAERHLDQCEECRSFYASLQRVLNIVDTLPVPARGPEYGAAVWQHIAPRVPVRRGWWALPLPAPWRWAGAAAAMAALLVVAFLAGRSYPPARRHTTMASTADPQVGERVLLVAVGDYLERTQTVLIELANASSNGPLDISSEQERAADLVSENRLFRQSAAHTGDTAVAGVLEELERVLMDISHEPSHLSPQDIERLRARLESEGILFKIRVLGTNVKNGNNPAGKLGQSPAGQKL